MTQWIEPWIGVDLDGTLVDSHSKGYEIGKPLERMIERIKALRREGKTIKIVTTRVDENIRAKDKDSVDEFDDYLHPYKQLEAIQNWCQQTFGEIFEVVTGKDCGMEYLIDDKVIRVEKDTGNICNGCRKYLEGGIDSTLFRRKFGDYYEVEEIGGGVYSTVLRALSSNECVYALKGIRKKWLNDEVVMKQFDIECKVSEILDETSNVFNFYGVQLIENQKWILMDYVIGSQNVGDMIKQNQSLKFYEDTYYRLAQDIDELHTHGIYHCDIKPRNILYSDIEDELILTDYGIAQIEGEDHYFDVTKFWGSVKDYIAPEIQRGERATEKTDQYMLAMTAYEMLHGHLNFTEEKSKWSRALSENPDDRFKSCVEFIESLEESK